MRPVATIAMIFVSAIALCACGEKNGDPAAVAARQINRVTAACQKGKLLQFSKLLKGTKPSEAKCTCVAHALQDNLEPNVMSVVELQAMGKTSEFRKAAAAMPQDASLLNEDPTRLSGTLMEVAVDCLSVK